MVKGEYIQTNDGEKFRYTIEESNDVKLTDRATMQKSAEVINVVFVFDYGHELPNSSKLEGLKEFIVKHSGKLPGMCSIFINGEEFKDEWDEIECDAGKKSTKSKKPNNGI